MKQYLDRAYSYTEYLKLIDDLLLENKTTGPVQSETMLNYAKLNRQRMRRLDNTVQLSTEVEDIARSNERPMIWLVITEGWCGDAAQNIPVIEKIAAASENIATRYVLRDENLELMDAFLTRGARSIPRLIAIDAQSLDVLGTWGPRPDGAQELFDSLKAQEVAKPLIMENLQRWYNTDASHSLQAEFGKLLRQWSTETTAVRVAA